MNRRKDNKSTWLARPHFFAHCVRLFGCVRFDDAWITLDLIVVSAKSSTGNISRESKAAKTRIISEWDDKTSIGLHNQEIPWQPLWFFAPLLMKSYLRATDAIKRNVHFWLPPTARMFSGLTLIEVVNELLWLNLKDYCVQTISSYLGNIAWEITEKPPQRVQFNLSFQLKPLQTACLIATLRFRRTKRSGNAAGRNSLIHSNLACLFGFGFPNGVAQFGFFNQASVFIVLHL